jgi:dihydrofolate synthase / folylpolyglutamate synthase
VAREHGCRVLQLGDDFVLRIANCGFGFDFRVAGQALELTNLQLAMPGAHQAANAAIALATIAELRHQGWCISTAAMRAGLAAARLPGRVEVIPGRPTIVLDTAHNAASARALVEALREISPQKRGTLILSVSRDKDVPAIVRELAPNFDRIVVTQYQENSRAMPTDALAELFREACGHRRVTACAMPHDAWLEALKQTEPDELVCIAGSFFLAAELRPIVLSWSAATASPSQDGSAI